MSLMIQDLFVDIVVYTTIEIAVSKIATLCVDAQLGHFRTR